jgi:heat shock protein HtpX
MYEAQAQNRWRTILIIAVFTLIVVAVAFVFGDVLGGSTSAGVAIIPFAVAISAGSALFSYFAGDKLVLAQSHARAVPDGEEKVLRDVVETLALGLGIPTPKLYVIEEPAPNAFATGRDPKHASVAVTRGLLEQMDRSELEGVIAHELSHVGNRDIRVMLLVTVLVGSVALLSDVMLRSLWWGGRSRDRDRGNAGAVLLLVGLVLAILTPVIATLIQLAVSRQREYLADASGAFLTRYPEGLANALRKIAADQNVLTVANKATASLYIAVHREPAEGPPVPVRPPLRHPSTDRGAHQAARSHGVSGERPPAQDRSLAYAVAASVVLVIVAIAGGIGAARLAQPAPSPSLPVVVPSPAAPASAEPPSTGPLVFTQPLSAGCVAGRAVYVVSDGGSIGRFADEHWELIDPVARSLVAATCTGDRLIAVGGGGRVVTIDDREQTIRSDSVQLDDFLGVTPLADGVLAVGRAGSVQRQGLGGWGIYATGIDEDLYAAAAFSPSSAWAVGAGGVTYRLEPDGWRPVPSGVTATLRSVSATSIDDAVVAGDDGVVLVWAGRWQQLADVPKVGYHAVLRAGAVTYAAGDSGTLISFSSAPSTGADQRRIDLGTTCTLRGLFSRGAELWVVGSDGGNAGVWRISGGTVFHWGQCQ